MVKDLEYDRIADPELERFQESITRGLRILSEGSSFPFGSPTPVIRNTYKAKYDELVRASGQDRAFTITLPQINKDDIGKSITFYYMAGSNSITISTGNDSTNIDSSTTTTLDGMDRFIVLVAMDTDLWGEL